MDDYGLQIYREERAARLRRFIVSTAFFAVIAVLLFALEANAQPLEAPTSTHSSQAAGQAIDWTQIILQVLMGFLALAGTVMTTVLIPSARAWLQAKASGEQANAVTKVLVGATLKLDTFIESGMAQVWGVFERDMADAMRPESEGGATVTPAELETAKGHVLAEVKKYLGTAGLAQLQSALGFGGELLEQFLKAQIEKKVQAAQEAGSIAAANVTSGQAAAAALSKL